MVDLRPCTEIKYEADRSDLLDKMDCYFEGKDKAPVVFFDLVEIDECDEVKDSVSIYPYAKDAE